MKFDCNFEPVRIIGAGLAGSEAAWQLAEFGIPVILHEMRPIKETLVHKSSFFAELVCSNSFRSQNDKENAVGLLHWEMKKANSLIMKIAEENCIPAGDALAVNRETFSSEITSILKSHPLVEIINEEITNLSTIQDKNVIVATGPLTSEKLTKSILNYSENDKLFFYDAISPIVYADSINFEKTWFQSRYDKGNSPEERKAYLNCGLNKIEYENFINELRNSKKIEFKEWEKKTDYFNGCLPIEIMAERGKETLRFGPMKPVGLTNPKNLDEKPYAVVQLRLENKNKSLFNIVGFQTKMRYEDQIRVFKTIPGLENVRFARLGGIHRNTYINSPKLLNDKLQLKSKPNIRFAGQITGVEGYVESAAIGMICAIFINAELKGKNLKDIPSVTSVGSLLNYLRNGSETNNFQPMNINFGLFPNLKENIKGRKNRRYRYQQYTLRAKEAWLDWLKSYQK